MTRISPIKSQDSGYSDSEEWCRSPNEYLTTAENGSSNREKSPYNGGVTANTTDYKHGSTMASFREQDISGLYPGGAREPDPWGRVKRAWSQEQAVWSRELKVNYTLVFFYLFLLWGGIIQTL